MLCGSKHNKKKSGFTLIELLVVLSIVFIMTSVSLVNYNRFGSSVVLENAAYDLALTIRQAQFFGINRSEQFGATDTDPQSYGVFFSLDDARPRVGGVDSNSFVMFVDKDNDDLFDTRRRSSDYCQENQSAECIRRFEFGREITIDEICVYQSGDRITFSGETCAGDKKKDTLHVSFKRPNPDAFISDGSRQGSKTKTYDHARITISSPQLAGEKRVIQIGAAGLISVTQ